MDPTSSVSAEPVNDMVAALRREDAFVGVGDKSSESFHGFAEDPSFLTLAVSHLKDGTGPSL